MERELDPGDYVIRIPCPVCNETVTGTATLEPVLTVPAGGDASIRVRVRTRAVPHKCSAPQLPGIEAG